MNASVVDSNSDSLKTAYEKNAALFPTKTKYRILLAEDTEMLQIAINGLLTERMGHTVVWAQNGQEAVDEMLKSEKEPFDVIIMDNNMPEMSGIEAAQKIRAKVGNFVKIYFWSDGLLPKKAEGLFEKERFSKPARFRELEPLFLKKS